MLFVNFYFDKLIDIIGWVFSLSEFALTYFFCTHLCCLNFKYMIMRGTLLHFHFVWDYWFYYRLLLICNNEIKPRTVSSSSDDVVLEFDGKREKEVEKKKDKTKREKDKKAVASTSMPSSSAEGRVLRTREKKEVWNNVTSNCYFWVIN